MVPDFYSIIDKSVRRSSVSISTILVNNSRIPKWEGVGTGFVVVLRGQTYFVTASHVLDCAFQYKQVIAKIFGQVVHLHGLYFASDPDLDISVTLLPVKWLESHGITTIYAPSVEGLPSIYEGTGNYVLAGFPASINRIDLRWPNRSTTMQFIYARLAERSKAPTKIRGALSLHYDHKAYGGRTPSALQGMSGGPLLEVMLRRIGDSKIGLSLNPRGVLCEWHKRERVVVASSIESVIKTIEDRSILWSLATESHALSAPSLVLTL